MAEMDCSTIEDMIAETASDLPNALIFTNLPHTMFTKEDPNPVKFEFERRLHIYDNQIKIAYLPNFRRARVEFTNGAVAAIVKHDMHEMELDGNHVNAYFVQIPALYDSPEQSSLNPPKPEKQFLISPPASPPVGWEPITEQGPIVNYDLIQAMLSLSTDGGEHELHPGCNISNIPKIVVHLTPEDALAGNDENRPPIEHTRRPPDYRSYVNGL